MIKISPKIGGNMLETFGFSTNRNEFDFYTTNPICVKDIVREENIVGSLILENSVGNGNIAKELIAAGNKVFGIDIVQRDYPLDMQADFLGINVSFLDPKLDMKFDCAVYNPPFSKLNEFIEKTWEFTDKQYIFCRLQVLETKSRYENIFSKGYLEKIYIYSSRVNNMEDCSSSMCFCWIVLNKNYKGEPIIRWL